MFNFFSSSIAIVGLGAGAPSEPVYFRADRPFMYYIRDSVSDSILFIGSFKKPEQ